MHFYIVELSILTRSLFVNHQKTPESILEAVDIEIYVTVVVMHQQ